MKITRDIGDDTPITYMPNFLPKDEADSLFVYLKNNMEWRQDIFKFGAKEVLVPRLTAFQADTGIKYRYAGLTQESSGIDNKLDSIIINAGIAADTGFNSVLLNYYRGERDSISLHSDSEKELGNNPIVASISLGGERRFDLVNNKDKRVKSFNIENGSLFIMGVNCQKNWKHKIDKYTGKDPRISLTFRWIYQELQ